MPRDTAFIRTLLVALITGLATFSSPTPGHAQDPIDEARTSADDARAQRATMLPSKKAILWAGPLRHLNKARAQAKLAKHGKLGVTVKKAFQEADAAVDAGRTWTGLANPMSAFSTASAPANARCNNPAGDGASAGQAETSIAALGDFVVTSWNDGQGFNTGGDTQGYAWSNDGGITFTDGGDVPHLMRACTPRSPGPAIR